MRTLEVFSREMFEKNCAPPLLLSGAHSEKSERAFHSRRVIRAKRAAFWDRDATSKSGGKKIGARRERGERDRQSPNRGCGIIQEVVAAIRRAESHPSWPEVLRDTFAIVITALVVANVTVTNYARARHRYLQHAPDNWRRGFRRA